MYCRSGGAVRAGRRQSRPSPGPGRRSPEEHHVELHRVEAGVEAGFDALQHAVERARLGHRGELFGVQRVQRDVHSLQPGVDQFGRAAGEKRAVGRHRHFHPLGDPADNLDEVLAQHRLAAGELHGVDVELAGDFEEADHVVGRHLVVLGRHRPAGVAQPLVVAVDAVEVTPIGQRDPDA